MFARGGPIRRLLGFGRTDIVRTYIEDAIADDIVNNSVSRNELITAINHANTPSLNDYIARELERSGKLELIGEVIPIVLGITMSKVDFVRALAVHGAAVDRIVYGYSLIAFLLHQGRLEAHGTREFQTSLYNAVKALIARRVDLNARNQHDNNSILDYANNLRIRQRNVHPDLYSLLERNGARRSDDLMATWDAANAAHAAEVARGERERMAAERAEAATAAAAAAADAAAAAAAELATRDLGSKLASLCCDELIAMIRSGNVYGFPIRFVGKSDPTGEAADLYSVSGLPPNADKDIGEIHVRGGLTDATTLADITIRFTDATDSRIRRTFTPSTRVVVGGRRKSRRRRRNTTRSRKLRR
jgi:hypothetical protein